MKSNMPVVEAVGANRLIHIVQSMVKCRAQLDMEAQRTLDESVLEFLGRNPLALATIMLDRTLPDTNPGVVEALLGRAYERATEAGRERVEKHAMEAGYFDLFAKPKAKDEGFLTRSQRSGLDRMLGLAKLHFEGRSWPGLALRTSVLVVGPSGVGKSNLVRQLAARLGGAFYFKLSFGEWAPTGAKTELTTLQRLRLAVEKHDRIVCHLDELDKVQAAPDSYSRALLTELYGVLDRQLGETVGSHSGWSADLLERLRQNVLFVGTGTWQDLWLEGGAKGIGFGGAGRPPEMAERIRIARTIPDELRLRFSPTLVILEPYTVRDFEEIVDGLKLPPGVLDPVAAAESGGNWRAVEAAVTEHCLRQLEAGEF